MNNGNGRFRRYCSYNDNGRGLNIGVAVIPEPETWAMLLAGLGLLGFAARRKKQQDAA